MFQNETSEPEDKMNWYLALLQMYRSVEPLSACKAQRCHYLVTASNHELAYRKSVELGNRLVRETYIFGGVEDLLLVYETPQDGSELSWSQIELTPRQLETEVPAKDQMRAFRSGDLNPSGWYVGRVVLSETHDEGSHGDRLLVWINTYFIVADSAASAYARALGLGSEHQDEVGSHMCDGERAHWEFNGVQDIIPVKEAPADGALLWCDDFEATSAELKNMIPNKVDLSVLKWAAQQEQQRSNK